MTIIGVIAAITIPNLIQSYKKHQVEVGVKEAYSLLNNALNMAKAENESWDNMLEIAYSNYNNASDYFAENYLKPYLKYSEYCKQSTPLNKCKAFNYSDFALDMNGNIIRSGSYNHTVWSRFILDNGMYLGTQQHIPYNNGTNAINFIVDINGNKEPNRNGYDVFYFGIFRSNTGLYCDITGTSHDYYCNQGNLLVASPKEYQKTALNDTCAVPMGTGCGAVIMRNGWKIPDDYPVKKF